jgi:hypothetical protein
MRPEESWNYTPREFAAFVKLREEHDRREMERWAVERSDFRNAYFFKDQFGQQKQWKPTDFLPAKSGPRPEAETSLEAEKMRVQGMIAAARGGQVDPSVLPLAFQMTPTEKANAMRNKPQARIVAPGVIEEPSPIERRGMVPKRMERKRG